MIRAMCKEIELQSSKFRNLTFSTIYFGGGTPSILTFDELKALLASARLNLNIEPDIEQTLEANPEDISPEKCDQLFELGFNRISLGVQSFNDLMLKKLNRVHNGIQAYKAIESITSSGITNVSIDLIFGLPDQTLSNWNTELNSFLELDLPHLSAYSLTIEEGTHFDYLKKSGAISIAEDERYLAMFHHAQKVMNNNGIPQYEISNYSKEGYRSKHNQSYWKGTPYLGIGPSAHSYTENQRWWNVSSNTKYIQSIQRGDSFYDSETLNRVEQFNEFLLTRLRTIEGIQRKNLEEYSDIHADDFWKQVEVFENDGLLEVNDQNIRISSSGLYLSDYISTSLFAE
jgi:oxygen-independent coproporphyrinogen-3 oxidase